MSLPKRYTGEKAGSLGITTAGSALSSRSGSALGLDPLLNLKAVLVSVIILGGESTLAGAHSLLFFCPGGEAMSIIVYRSCLKFHQYACHKIGCAVMILLFTKCVYIEVWRWSKSQ